MTRLVALLAALTVSTAAGQDYTPGGPAAGVDYSPGSAASPVAVAYSPGVQLDKSPGTWDRVPDVEPLRLARVADPVPAGDHWHTCPNGHSWHHGPGSRGSSASHSCPACGLQDWTPENAPRGSPVVASGQNYPAAVVTYTQASFSQQAQSWGVSQGCPNGNCPTGQQFTSRRGLFGFR